MHVYGQDLIILVYCFQATLDSSRWIPIHSFPFGFLATHRMRAYNVSLIVTQIRGSIPWSPTSMERVAELGGASCTMIPDLLLCSLPSISLSSKVEAISHTTFFPLLVWDSCRFKSTIPPRGWLLVCGVNWVCGFRPRCVHPHGHHVLLRSSIGVPEG